MFNSTFKTLALAGAMAAALALTGCLQGEDTGPVPDMHLKVSTTVDGLNKPSTLSKGSVIAYSKLIIQMTSNASTPDTVRDTITPGEQNFGSVSTTPYTVDSNYVLKGLRTWKVLVIVKDTKDSIIHRDSIMPGSYLRVADTLVGTLNLAPRFAMFRAIFGTLPDSISSGATGNLLKQQVKFTRLVVKIDGVIKGDSISPTYFAVGSLDTVFADYVTLGVSHTVRLIAYGEVRSAAGVVKYNDSLFVGNGLSSFTPTAGTDASMSNIALAWAGPNTGMESLTVTIGKVGVTTLSGTISGSNAVPKSR